MDYKGGKINVVIEINKDIDRYHESVAMGLSAKQLIFSIASVVCGGGLVFLLYPYIGLTGAAYVAIPVVAPIALGGFYSYNGMSFYEVMGKKIHFMFGNRTLTYVSTEGEQAIRSYEFEKIFQIRRVLDYLVFARSNLQQAMMQITQQIIVQQIIRRHLKTQRKR